MAQGLLVSIAKWPKHNQPAVVTELFFEDVEEGRQYEEDNKSFVFHTQLIELVKCRG